MKIQKLYEDRGLLNESPNSDKQILTELISDSSFIKKEFGGKVHTKLQ